MMEEKVFSFMEQYKMLSNGDNVIVALSGGADSMALFRFFLYHKETLGITLHAAHFEHGLRGEESQRDADFVERLCSEKGIPLHMRHGDMANKNAPQGESTESWARLLRYEFFEELSKKHNAKIATAHTLTDNAETVLFRAVRGSGPKGLGGIPPVRGAYIRPLLTVSREEVEDYCEANRLSYVTDSTNLQPCFTRNKLRLDVMPLLEEVHPGAQNALGRLAQDMRELDIWLEELAQQLLEKASQKEVCGGKAWRRELIEKAPSPLRKQALAAIAGEKSNRKLLMLMEQVVSGEAAAVDLPGERRFYRQGDCLYLQEKQPPFPQYEYSIPLQEGEICLPGGFKLEIWVQEEYLSPNEQDNYSKTGKKGLTFVADYGRITKCSVFRTRRQGDVFSPCRRGVSKTLKKWMNEEKIPLQERARLPLLAKHQQILWVWNGGFCQQVQPTKDTKQFLMIRQIVEEECQNHDIS